jgi:hypothetical protein
MTGRQLSTDATEAIFAEETDKVFITLLTISHPSWPEDIRFASDPFEELPSAVTTRGVVSRGDEYVFIPFSVNLPDQNDTGNAKASISIDNINRQIVDRVRRADSAIRVKIEVVLNTSIDTPEITIENFRLEQVTYDAFTVSGDISLQYYDLEPFPSKQFTPSDFPGLF